MRANLTTAGPVDTVLYMAQIKGKSLKYDVVVYDDVYDPWPEAWEPEIGEVQDAALGVTIVYAVVPTVDGLGRTVKREVPLLAHRQQRVTAAIDTREVVRGEAKAVYAEQRLAWITTQRLEGESSNSWDDYNKNKIDADRLMSRLMCSSHK